MEIATHANATPQLGRTLTTSFSLSSVARSALRPAAQSTITSTTDPAMNAAYAATSPLVHSQAHTGSSYSIQSRTSNRSSNTTEGTSHSTLFPPPPMSSPPGPGTPNGNEVTANDNVMNSVADASKSLFQICVGLRQRLKGVPGCEEAFLQIEQEAEDDTDPVTLLWRTIRRGQPLISIYTLLRPGQPMNLPSATGPNSDIKRGKAAAFKFLQACITDLKIPQEKLFIITDLYADDTTGFVKVARVVNWGLDELVRRGDIEDFRTRGSDLEGAGKGKRTQRQHIIAELVTTERTYVTHLEILQAFKNMVEEKGIIPGDACHHIFLNLNNLLDFQRRFLIRVEQINFLPEEEQNWGSIFQQWDQGFKVYEPYIANQAKCERMVVAEFPRLKEAGGSIEMRQMVESAASLYGFLMKPFQRLSKYPLLLDDLYKKGDLDEQKKQDLLLGKEVVTTILQDANKAVDAEQKLGLVRELSARVDDWKGLDPDAFGKLLLYSPVTLLKGDNVSNSKDSESQVRTMASSYSLLVVLICLFSFSSRVIRRSNSSFISLRRFFVAASQLILPSRRASLGPGTMCRLTRTRSRNISSKVGSSCKTSQTSCLSSSQVCFLMLLKRHLPGPLRSADIYFQAHTHVKFSGTAALPWSISSSGLLQRSS
jgi:cell division control protein 24